MPLTWMAVWVSGLWMRPRVIQHGIS